MDGYIRAYPHLFVAGPNKHDYFVSIRVHDLAEIIKTGLDEVHIYLIGSYQVDWTLLFLPDSFTCPVSSRLGPAARLNLTRWQPGGSQVGKRE